MNILAIDPGHTESAYVIFDTETSLLIAFGKIANEGLLEAIRQEADEKCGFAQTPEHMVIEQIASYGMSVGAETVVWSGRFIEAWDRNCFSWSWSRIKRLEVKMHLCHDSRAKDKNIRQALIDRYGPGRDLAIGKKKTPGSLYGVSGDEWAALAVAVTYADKYAITALPAGEGLGGK